MSLRFSDSDDESVNFTTLIFQSYPSSEVHLVRAEWVA